MKWPNQGKEIPESGLMAPDAGGSRAVGKRLERTRFRIPTPIGSAMNPVGMARRKHQSGRDRVEERR
jgi:hypothetical protein